MAVTTSAITTSWTPPDPLTGVSVSAIEELAHIQLDWDTSTLADVDFSHYSVERRLVGESTWTVLASIGAKTTLQYKDASAGQGVAYEYQVVNYKVIPGDSPLASEGNDVLAAMLESDIWFVIGNENPNDEVNSFELPVFDETHTRPIQQEVFEPIAHARKKVARGNVLGYEGSLTLRWATGERTLAKTQLEFMAVNAGPHFLKSPFGDVWRVEFDAPDYKYSGGGNMLVEIGWVEVA